MEGLEVRVTAQGAHRDGTARVHPRVLAGLWQAPGPCTLRFGTRRVRVRVAADPSLGTGQVDIPLPLAESLCLPGSLRAGLRRQGGELVLGPLIGLLVSPQALARLRRDGLEPPYSGYARWAAELGAILCLFSAGDVDLARQTIAGLRPEGGAGRTWRLTPARFPLPRVVLSRVFSDERAGARAFLSRAPALDCIVLRLGPLGHLEGLRIVSAQPDLVTLIPWTRPVRGDTLTDALSRFSEIVIKPDLPAAGTGVYHLRRRRRGWLLTGLPASQRRQEWLPNHAAVHAVLGRLAAGGGDYLLQEGVPRATFLGHPFDLLALVQQDGHGRWEASALVARVLPAEADADPAAAGWTAPAEVALRHAFPERWEDVWKRARRAAAAAARAVDRERGPRFELGVHLAVSPNGRIHLLQVEGELRVEHLAPLHDPYAARRVYGCPIACAVALDGENGHVPRSPAGTCA